MRHVDLLKQRLEALRQAPEKPLAIRFVVTDGEPLVVGFDDAWRFGVSTTPDVIVTAHSADLIDLLEGFGSFEAALTDRRLRVAGDLGRAMRWLPLFFENAEGRSDL